MHCSVTLIKILFKNEFAQFGLEGFIAVEVFI